MFPHYPLSHPYPNRHWPGLEEFPWSGDGKPSGRLGSESYPNSLSGLTLGTFWIPVSSYGKYMSAHYLRGLRWRLKETWYLLYLVQSTWRSCISCAVLLQGLPLPLASVWMAPPSVEVHSGRLRMRRAQTDCKQPFPRDANAMDLHDCQMGGLALWLFSKEKWILSW